MAELGDFALTDTFLEWLYRDSYLQSVQSQFTHQQLLDVAWEQCISVMAPMMLRARRSLFREVHDITLVEGTSTYDIPQYAMLNKLHLAYLTNSNGDIAKLKRRDPAEDVFYPDSANGFSHAIRLLDKQIEVKPPPDAGTITTWPTLRTYIYRRPSRFVRATDDGTGNNPARAARILSIASPTLTYTTLMPSDFSASSAHDFYSQTSPYRRLATNISASAAPDTSSQTFAAATVALLAAGDYACLNGETCILPLPLEMISHLKTLTIKSLSNTQGDREAYKACLEKMQEDLASMYAAMTDELEENPKTVSLLHSPFLQAMRRTRSMVRS